MTTQDYIDAEVQRERDARAQAMGQSERAQAQYGHWCQQQAQMYGNPGPSEVILLRAKVRELTDKLAAETERCAMAVLDFDDYPIDRDQMERIAAHIRSGK